MLSFSPPLMSSVWHPILLLVLASTWIHNVVGQDSRQYTVANNCPSSINLYIGGAFDSALASGGRTTKTLDLNAGFFYTDTNGGDTNGLATRAGFREEYDSHYYYIVKDMDHFNTGMSITPNHPEENGFCAVARCDTAGCSTAFAYPPRPFPPPVPGTAPTPPVYSCPFDNLNYTITFCPAGTFPGQAPSAALHPNSNTDKCIDVRGANYANGTPVQIYDCNGTGAQKWVFNRGSTKVKLADSNFCLDAGSSPGNGVGMKIWQCYDNLPAQQWYYTDDNRIALEGQGLCLDLTNGVLTNSNQLQTWQCTDFNTNQIWTI